MKLNKIILKSLIFSIFISNLNNVTFANTEISNRYETLEGEQVYVNNSFPGELKEISIFGNTIQDSNNLEDIQSVGDLYVNKNGEPILDSQGRKQYKINIINCLDYSNYENFNTKQLTVKSIKTSPWDSQYFSNHVIPITNVNDSFDLVIIRKDNENILLGQAFFRIFATIVNDDGNIIKNLGNYTMKKNKEEMVFQKKIGNLKDYIGYNLVISFRDINLTSSGVSGNDFFDNFDIGLKNESVTEIFPLSADFNEIELLLPTQLMKVGNTADELYWDDDENRYLIKKNVSNIYLKDTKKSEWYTNPAWSNGMHFKLGTVSQFNFNTYEKQFSTINGLRGSTGNGVGVNVCGVDMHNRLVIELSEYNIDNFDEVWEWIELNNPNFYATYWTPEIIQTNITKKINIPTYNVRTSILSKSENGIKPKFKVVIDRLPTLAENSIIEAVTDSSIQNIALARMLINMLPDSLYKDQLQAKLNEIFSSEMVLEKQSATANLDVYVKSENILMMSLDTNTITFEDYSGVEELELLDAINISINSSLPYSLNAYIVGDITNKDKDKALDLDILNIRDSSATEYKKFESINNKLVLKDNCSKGNNISHNIDLKLNGDNAHDADVYKTTIKFEAEQK